MLAIIGGTGIYQLQGGKIIEQIEINTPFGLPSAKIIKLAFNEKEILFLPRHGNSHSLLPHEINYRANIYALKKLGVRQMISFSATGSLRAKIHPGDFAIASQYFDFIKGNREKTFFGDGLVAHVSTAQPVCQHLTNWIVKTASKVMPEQRIHQNKTYAAVDGPRFGTKSESEFLRNKNGANCDLVGMTNVPEVFLAREAQINYASVGIVTDFDCWMDDPTHQVSVSEVIKTYGKSIAKAQKLLSKLLKTPFPEIDQDYRQTLNQAMLSDRESLSDEKKSLLQVLES